MKQSVSFPPRERSITVMGDTAPGVRGVGVEGHTDKRFLLKKKSKKCLGLPVLGTFTTFFF